MATAISPLTSTPAPASAANPGASSTSGASASSTSASGINDVANESTFLQLMISELENQDPENPTDGTEFITQLAEFSSVQSQTESASDLDSILALMQQGANLTASSGAPAAATGAAGSSAPAPGASVNTAAPAGS